MHLHLDSQARMAVIQRKRERQTESEREIKKKKGMKKSVRQG